MQESRHYEIEDILAILPHGYPFLLVDYVKDLNPQSILAVKNITYNENYFQGHFFKNPVMPGVLILEALAQASAILASSILDVKKGQGDVLLTSINDAKFKKIVKPGDILELHSEVMQHRGVMWKFKTFAQVQDKIVAQAIITAVFNKSRD